MCIRDRSATEVLNEADADLANLPVIVISSTAAHERRLAADLALAQRSKQGRHIVASGSGHWVPLDAPQAVTDAIVEIVQHIRGRQA